MSKFKLVEKLLWFYIILLPIREIPSLPFLNQKLQYADLVFIILFVACMINYARGRFRFKWNWFDLSILFLLIAYLPSFYNSKNHLSSIIELSGLIYLISLYLLIKNIIDTKEKFIFLTKIWVITGVVVSLIGMIALAICWMIGQLRTNAFLFYTEVEATYHILPRIDSVFRNANMYANYLLVSIVFAFILLYYNFENKRKRFLIICALAIMFLGAFLAGSRQQVGIYLSSFLILSKFDKNRIFPVLRRLAFFVFLALLVVGILTTVWTVAPVNFKNNIEKGIFKVEMNSKYSWHIFTQHASINMIKRHPIVGVGLGNYKDNFTAYVDWERAESSYHFIIPSYKKLVKDKKLVLDPLSTYLGSFAETGLIGFMALSILLASFAISLFNFYKNRLNNFSRQLSWFILSGFFGFLINGFIIEILTMRHFWIMMAMGMSSTYLRANSDTLSNRGGKTKNENDR
ncbi:MAG: O-antigen ligase family protein [Candidatus Omnitrophota bacterium]|nr:MAG: O-antigen ligase family protein [Candidatus Omnitrophota bacterium]